MFACTRVPVGEDPVASGLKRPMQRSITGFQLDGEQHWLAELVCGHRQHTRHSPPFTEREWVLSEAGRTARLGTMLDCVRCDRRELPDGFAPYRRTPEFDQASVPAALLKRHDTKPGVWGLIHVARGELEYTVHEPVPSREIVCARAPAVILPEVPHEVRPLGEVAFYVEFWRHEP